MTPSETSRIINEKRLYQICMKIRCIRNPEKKKKLRIGDKVRISKYKLKVFDKGYTPNWTEEVFVIAEILNTIPVTYKLVDLMGEAVSGSFYQQEL